MKKNINLQIIVPCQTRYLSLIGKIGENLAKEVCLSKIDRNALANDLNTVLTEAMVNTIKHGCKSATDSEVRIIITLSQNELLIKVYDSGRGFDLDMVPNLKFDADLLQESGRGIHIIRKLMDSVVYRKSSGGNVLEMKKALE